MKELIDLNVIALQIAEKIRDEATEPGVCPVLSRDLQKSITPAPAGHGQATVGSNLSYARAVHDGRPAITIRPKKGKKALRFKIGGRFVFARTVEQPARKGQPYLREGAAEVQRKGYDFLDRYLEDRAFFAIREKIKKSINLDLV